jgi:hypothetical protein
MTQGAIADDGRPSQIQDDPTGLNDVNVRRSNESKELVDPLSVMKSDYSDLASQNNSNNLRS